MNIDPKPTEQAAEIARLVAEAERLHGDYIEAKSQLQEMTIIRDNILRELSNEQHRCRRLFDMLEGIIEVARK